MRNILGFQLGWIFLSYRKFYPIIDFKIKRLKTNIYKKKRKEKKKINQRGQIIILVHFSNSCFFPSKFASRGFDWMAFFFSFLCNEKCFIPFTFTSTLVSMVWVDFLVGNDKCLIGRKLCRMMHKVINDYGFMP